LLTLDGTTPFAGQRKSIAKQEFSMSKFSKALALAFVSVALIGTSSVAVAREGARSVGKGIKCSTRSMVDATGKVVYYQYCYKSI